MLRAQSLLFAVAFVAACADRKAAGDCSKRAETNSELALFDRPFKGIFLLMNHFDHAEPNEIANDNRHQVSWCGARRTWEIDGHSGYDWALPIGTELYAPAEGVVITAEVSAPFDCPLLGRQVTDNQQVSIAHYRTKAGDAYISSFSHLDRIDVQQGQIIKAGDRIGLSGGSGCATGPHLHFEVSRNGYPVDPYGWQGLGEDPSRSAQSVWLWKPGQAPSIFHD